MTENTLNYFLSKHLCENISNSVLIAVFSSLVAVLLMAYLQRGKRKYKLPPGPAGLPILGYVPFLGEDPHKELNRLKSIYGNVFSLYFGLTYTVILGDYEAVKDAFSKSTTLDRPPRTFDFIPDAVGFSSVNGEEWKEHRKFCTKSMKEHGVGQSKWENIVQIEVIDFIKIISSYNGEPFDIDKIVTSSVSNNVSAFILGKRLPCNHPDRKFLDEEMDEIMQHLSAASIFNVFAVLRDISIALGIGPLAKAHKRMVEFNNFFRKEVKEIRENCSSGEMQNFVTDYLEEMNCHDEKCGHNFNETNLYGNIQALFLGGSDTTRTSINWLVIIMANFRDLQSKVQKEMDSVLGEDEEIQWSDRKKLPYTFATIMEAQRWRTIAPLNTPRIAMEDIQIQNYDIPKGTTIIANNWGLHNDPKYWKEPTEFDPGRFLTNNGKEVVLKPSSYVPFSYGKRSCPGEAVAMMEIFLYFTALMQKFIILIPKGAKVDLNGKLGLTYRTYPQKFHFISRKPGMNVLDHISN